MVLVLPVAFIHKQLVGKEGSWRDEEDMQQIAGGQIRGSYIEGCSLCKWCPSYVALLDSLVYCILLQGVSVKGKILFK